MHIEFKSLSPGEAYAMLTQTVVPRPVAWVLSLNVDDSLNLAPFSFFNAVCSDPPTIMLSIGRHADGREKDTRRNIRERGEFVVHIAHSEQAGAMTSTSASLAPGRSELEHAGDKFGSQLLRLVSMPGSSLPRLAECRVAFACQHTESLEIGSQAVIFARVSDIWLDEQIVDTDAKGRTRVDAKALDPIGRLGGGEYVTAGSVITVERPS